MKKVKGMNHEVNDPQGKIFQDEDGAVMAR